MVFCCVIFTAIGLLCTRLLPRVSLSFRSRSPVPVTADINNLRVSGSFACNWSQVERPGILPPRANLWAMQIYFWKTELEIYHWVGLGYAPYAGQPTNSMLVCSR